LLVKLVGANALAVVMAAVVAARQTGGHPATVMVWAAAFAVLAHAALVVIALRPVHDLETMASRVWRGDYAARFESSAVTDHGVLRLGAMFNLLLDGLAAD